MASISLQAGEVRKVRIESIAFGGVGVGRIEGVVIFVPYTVTHDEVEVEIKEIRKKYALGIIKSIIAPSEFRVNPTCSYFGECGGCQLQHVAYDHQLEVKRRQVQEIYARLGRFTSPPLLDIIPSPHWYHYRGKADYHVQWERGKVVAAGFMHAFENRVLDIERCDIVEESINQRYAIFRTCQFDKNPPLPPFSKEGNNSHPPSNKGYDNNPPLSKERNHRQPLFSKGGRNNDPPFSKGGNHSQSPFSKGGLGGFVRFPGERHTIWSATEEKEATPAGDPDDLPSLISRIVKGRHLAVPYGGFFQVNASITGALVDQVLDFAALKGNEMVVDGYCGVGLFSLFLAPHAGRVIGIELNGDAITCARSNLQEAGIGNTVFLQGDMGQTMKQRFNKKGQRPDVLLLDPPRIGCSKDVLDGIIKMKVKKVIYVSCNPSTQARDVRYLVDQGFTLRFLQPLDMFPQTGHIEIIAVLETD